MINTQFSYCKVCGESERCVEFVDGKEYRTCKNLCLVPEASEDVKKPFKVHDHRNVDFIKNNI